MIKLTSSGFMNNGDINEGAEHSPPTFHVQASSWISQYRLAGAYGHIIPSAG